MPDAETPAEQPLVTPDANQPAPPATSPEPADAAPDGATTAGGYSYEVVDDSSSAQSVPDRTSRRGAPWWLVAIAVIVPAALVGAAVWFIFGRADGESSSAEVSATNLLHTFTSGGEGTTTTKYEGELPPGYPEGIPAYDDAEVVASVLQIQGEDAGFIIVSDTSDPRDDVNAFLREHFDEDPWQITAGSDDRESTAYQFSKTDDPDISGIVLVTSSKDGNRTTIVTSVQQVAGAAEQEADPFEPGVSRSKPQGFPEEIPVYEGAMLIDASFQNDPQGDGYAISLVTTDDPGDVLDFYTGALEDAGLTVEEADASGSALENAETITFADDELLLQGDLTVGDFPEADGYTQIDIQVGDQR